jgi:hypothetical protein
LIPFHEVTTASLSGDAGQIAHQSSRWKRAFEKVCIDGVIDAGRAAAVAGVAIAIE